MYKRNRHNIGYARYTELSKHCMYIYQQIYLYFMLSIIVSAVFRYIHWHQFINPIYKSKDKVNRVSLVAANASLMNE